MSGGFFRGTSADQDTRFSNKQAKLLKSQKFAPELDHLVDTTKVKMDVIRPWIATRATELLGFEDEVLINFVYGLLDGKEVDGKQIQIQLTGFMEKNTGKFMKELWSLLLSAQKNASGVPQLFLDAKEEEMRKKKVETDRITQEILQRKEREGREPERGKHIGMDGGPDILRSASAVPDTVSKRSLPRASSVDSKEEREADARHGRRTKNRSSKSPHSNDHSPSSCRKLPSATRSSSKSFSKSRSYSEERPKSRSVSVSSQSQRHSISPERQYRSPTKRYISPARQYMSPPRRSISPRRRYAPQNTRSPSRRSRRRSGSHPQHRSPSPFRQRSPHARRRSPPFPRRRSPSPLRHSSPSPSRRRSPVRWRSPSPSRRRSPVRWRSPSPSRHRSPGRRRSPSPSRHMSPIRRRSLSPTRRRSPSPLRRRSPPPRSPKHRRRPPLHSPRNRAAGSQISPRRRKRSQSPSYRTRRSLSRERDSRTNGVDSKRHQDEYASHRSREKRSALHHALYRQMAERPDLSRKVSNTVSRRLPNSLRSPQRDSRDLSDIRNRVPIVPPEKSPNQSESPPHVQKTNPRKDKRSRSSSESPVKQTKERMPRYDNSETTREEERISHARGEAHSRTDSLHNKSKDLPAHKGLKKFHASDFSPEVYSPDRSADNRSQSSRGCAVKLELIKKPHEERRDMDLAERLVRRVIPSSEGVEYGPGRVREQRFSIYLHEKEQSTKQHARAASSLEGREYDEQAVKHSGVDGCRVSDEKQSHSKNDEYIESHYEKESVSKSKRKVDKSNLSDGISSDTEETETYKFPNMEKRRHKKSDKHRKDVDDGSESESEIDDRKEAKRRRKDEKRLRKEERRRRREERHRRRLERRASKLKAKSMDTVAPPSDIENNLDESDGPDGDAVVRKDSHPSDTEEPESEQKLEIELRKKALESLKAKKAISH